MLKSFNFVTAVLLLTLSTACQGNVETAKRKYVESGDRYVAQGKYSEAVIQYANAINKDPKFGEAHAKLADTYLAQGNMRDAVLEYVRAADLLPDQAAAQLKAGHVLLLGGLFEEARVRARRVLEKDPSNVEALVLTGNALAGLKDLDEALSVLQHALDYDPERVGTYTTVGVLQLARGDSEEAEKSFQKALATSNGSAEAHLGLGNFYRAVGRKADAERELKRALDLDPKRVDANQALAGFYVETDRAPEAEPYLKAVVALSKDKSAASALADYYTSQRRFDDAVRTLDELSSDPKQFMAARTRIAFVEFAAGNRPKAHEVIDDVLVREPRNALALTTKARLLLADGRTDLALERAKQAIDADSRSPQAQLTLGRVLVATNDSEGARRAFAESLRLEPNSLPPLLELVDLHQRRGQLDTATELADQAVRSHPANVAARLALVGVLTVRSEDHPRAQTELRWLLGRYPKSAPVRTAQGAYLLSERDPAGARDAFNRALELDPLDRKRSRASSRSISRRRILRMRATMSTARSRERPARRRCSSCWPRSSSRRTTSARPRRRFEKRSRAIRPTRNRTGCWRSSTCSRETRDAKHEFSEIARLQPRSIAAPTLLGVLCYATRDMAGARSWWETALRVDPNAAAAANNLAWLYAELGTNLDAALELALRPGRRCPISPKSTTRSAGCTTRRRWAARRPVSRLQRRQGRDQSRLPIPPGHGVRADRRGRQGSPAAREGAQHQPELRGIRRGTKNPQDADPLITETRRSRRRRSRIEGCRRRRLRRQVLVDRRAPLGGPAVLVNLRVGGVDPDDVGNRHQVENAGDGTQESRCDRILVFRC